MSELACLVGTKFTDLVDGTEMFGFCVWDDYCARYYNGLDVAIHNDVELYELARKVCDADMEDILDSTMEDFNGIRINGTWYKKSELES